MTDRDRDPRESLIDMAQGYFRGKVLCAAARLEIADAFGGGEKSVDELAAATATNSDALHRLLRALASIGVVEQVAPARFALTALGEPLRRDAPHSVRASIVFWADLLADSWTYIAECVRAGDRRGASAAMERVGAKSRWATEPEAQAIFHAVFAEPGPDEMAAIVAAHDFSRCRIVADLGGAGGSLIAAILMAHPHVSGILVDRQGAMDRAAARLASEGLAERCRTIAGDLLESVPHGADIYTLKFVLHGYDDEDARRILRNCAAAMPPQGRLLIIENVLPERVEPDPRVELMLMSDINMLAVTGGRERGAREWESLLSSAGFEIRRVGAIPDSIASIIEAARAANEQPAP